MYQQPCHISSAWWPWSLVQVECGEPGLPWGRLPWGIPGPSRTLHLTGAHSALSRRLAWPCHPTTTRQHNCGQVFRFGHLCFRVSFGWRGRKGQSSWVKGHGGLFVQLEILPDRQHVWRGAWPSDIPPYCYLSSHFSSISTFPCCTVDSHIPPPGLFSPLIVLADLHTFSSAFSRLDLSFSQISSVPLPIVS